MDPTTSAERALLATAQNRKHCDLRSTREQDDARWSPTGEEAVGWGDGRTVHAAFLRHLVCDRNLPVHLTCARIDGHLDLSDQSIILSMPKCVFAEETRFEGATFAGDASFDGATFTGPASFDGATIEGDASFNKVTIEGDASFDEVTFSGPARFNGATFGQLDWSGTWWSTSRVSTTGLAAERFVLDRAAFGSTVRLDVTAGAVSAKGLRAVERLHLVVAGAAVELTLDPPICL